MLDLEDIVNIVIAEAGGDASIDISQLEGDVPPLTRQSPHLSLVSFRCFMQDTGYPMEVYSVDGTLQERWVGWATECATVKTVLMKDDQVSSRGLMVQTWTCRVFLSMGRNCQ